jgi:hypothetical protein
MNIVMNIVHYADILAIPLFLLLTIYFYRKNNRTFIENILLLFAVSGFVLDSYFSYQFVFS